LGIRLGMATRLSPVTTTPKRAATRQPVVVPARLTWKDASGAVRFTSVTTRDVSEAGAFVDADNSAAIPLFRIVHLQLERGARELNGLPERLREGRVLSAIWRVGPTRASRGTPAGYALRFLVDPGVDTAAAAPSMAVAS
jgi:hypothetical protein